MKDNDKVNEVYETVQKMFGDFQQMKLKTHKVRCD